MNEQTATVEAPVELELAELDEIAGGRKAGGNQQEYVVAPDGAETKIIAVLIGL